jgi:hypothetical protein
MADKVRKSFKRPLHPMERIFEILFGLIMVLTFTCAVSVTHAHGDDIRRMLFAALGCNLVWGIIDAVFYLLGMLSERGHDLITFRALQKAADPADADRIFTDALPPVLVKILSTSEIQSMRQRLQQLPESPRRPHLTRGDWLGATGVLLLVFLSTFPVVGLFIFLADLARAMRVSNGIAIVMLFLVGYAFGDYSGYRPLRVGLFMVVLGVAMVALTIALGG